MKKIRWGVLGIGLISRDFMIPALLNSDICELTMIASRSEQPADYLPGVKRAASYDELIASDEVDAIYVPVPNALHCEWTVKALQHKKHVLCEKPIAMNRDEAELMYRTAKENGVLLMEAFMYRYGCKFRKLAELLSENAIGCIRFMQGNHGYPLTWASPAREDRTLGGGCLYDVGCYVVDCMNYVMKQQGAEAKTAEGVFRMKGGVDFSTSGSVRFSDDTTASLAAWFDAQSSQRMLLVGEEGTIEIPNIFEPCDGRVILTKGEEVTVFEVKEETDPYQIEAEMLVGAILGEDVYLIPEEDTLRNMQLLDLLHAKRPE